MDEKITFTAVPSYAGWQLLLKNMTQNYPLIFYNQDNVAANGRKAIKTYYQNVAKGNCPARKFKTATDTKTHTFTIYLDEEAEQKE